MAAGSPVYWPSESERVVVTRHPPFGKGTSYIGTATQIMPYEEDDNGVWVGGWLLTGKNMVTGQEEHSYWACSEMLMRYHGALQTVRPATEEEWETAMG